MRRVRKLPVMSIIASLLIGVFFAAIWTDIAYPSSSLGAPNGERQPYIEGVVHYDGFVYKNGVLSSEGRPITSGGGIVYESVLSHPKDLINNVQNSQARFLGTFAVMSLTTFAILGIIAYSRNKNQGSTTTKSN